MDRTDRTNHFAARSTEPSSPIGWIGHSPERRRAFSMVELLVVIAIIVALVGLLLVALRSAQNAASNAKTLSSMKAFANAAEQFNLEHGRYPGIVPDDVLMLSTEVSSTENALFDLMGGAQAYHPILRQKNLNLYTAFAALEGSVEVTFGTSDWKIAYNPDRFGEGPVIDGKSYEPYLSVDDNVVRPARGSEDFPDLVDAWGQPVMYLRRVRESGPLVSDDPADRPQFLFAGLKQYIAAGAIGELGFSQTNTNGEIEYSILNAANPPTPSETLAQIIRNPAVGEPMDPLSSAARGGFVLISAGADGIYFSVTDGPGTRDMPVINIVDDADTGNPKVVEGYDDIRVFGGS
jgi:type II secretory pathway pseudopilin PulG